MLTFSFIIFTLFAIRKFFILDSFRDFIYFYENILQTKCKQFGLFSYLCKFIKSLKVLILCVFATTVLIFFPTSTCSSFTNIYTTINIICITCIYSCSSFGNISIICIYCTNFIYQYFLFGDKMVTLSTSLFVFYMF